MGPEPSIDPATDDGEGEQARPSSLAYMGYREKTEDMGAVPEQK